MSESPPARGAEEALGPELEAAPRASSSPAEEGASPPSGASEPTDASRTTRAAPSADAERLEPPSAAEAIASPSSSSAPAPIVLLDEDGTTAWVRRKIAVFRRLEPMDARRVGTFAVPESPFLEVATVEVRMPKKAHAELVLLGEKRRRMLQAGTGLFTSYDPAGWLIAGGGGGLVGVWLDYLPRALFWPLVGAIALGVLVGLVTRHLRARVEERAARAWDASPEREEHDALARTLSKEWGRAQARLQRESGYHGLIRVAEGSVEPLRLASIDPRPYEADPPYFDPDDFLPSEAAGAVRYEQVRASGEIVTRALDGTSDFREA